MLLSLVSSATPSLRSLWLQKQSKCSLCKLENGARSGGPDSHLHLLCITLFRTECGWSFHQLSQKLGPCPILTHPFWAGNIPLETGSKATPPLLKNRGSYSRVYMDSVLTGTNRNRHIPLGVFLVRVGTHTVYTGASTRAYMPHGMHIFIPSRPSLVHAVTQSCPTLCDPVGWSPPGSSVHGISQARILEWVAISSSRGSFQSRDWTQVSHTPYTTYHCATSEALSWTTRDT